MLKNLSIRAKLIALIGLFIVATAAIVATALSGLTSSKASLDEVGRNRMPSVQGLMTMDSSYLQSRISLIRAADFENNYNAGEELTKLLKANQKAWADFEKGWKIYEPLPQSKEEEQLWKEYVKTHAQYKAAQSKITDKIVEWSKLKNDPKTQKRVYAEYYQARNDARPIITKASEQLDAIVELNVKYGDDAVKMAEASADRVKVVMYAVSALCVLLSIGVGLYVLRSTLAQLGGEPALVSEIVKAVAAGDLNVKIETKAGDNSSMMVSVKEMVGKLAQVIGETQTVVSAAAHGDLSKRIELGNKQGFAKELGVGINQLADTSATVMRDVGSVLARMAEGDLTPRIDRDYEGDFEKLALALNGTLDKLSATINEVRGTAEGITAASGQVSATSQSLSQATSEQAASLEETTSAIEQMSASIAQNTENSKVTDGIAKQSADDAKNGGEAVRATVEAMRQIASKIGIIDDIAYRTDLLALNAAIEAARAGEHGMGFAVVAAEVRKLAERSQIAAQEIGELAKSSVSTAEQAGKLLGTMLPSIQKTADLVREITFASNEQSTGAGQISTAMAQLNSTTQQNAASSEQLSATAEEMNAQAEQLMVLVGQFQVAGRGKRAARTSAPDMKVIKGDKAKAMKAKNPVESVDQDEFVEFA